MLPCAVCKILNILSHRQTMIRIMYNFTFVYIIYFFILFPNYKLISLVLFCAIYYNFYGIIMKYNSIYFRVTSIRANRKIICFFLYTFLFKSRSDDKGNSRELCLCRISLTFGRKISRNSSMVSTKYVFCGSWHFSALLCVGNQR